MIGRLPRGPGRIPSLDMTTLHELDAAAAVVYTGMRPTTEQRWPLLDARCGTAVWVKHENQTPVGAFKVRGGLVYFDALRRTQPEVTGVVAATRGNHGQSVAFAARWYGISATVVVPHGNSPDKNRAMRALGAELIEGGHDFQASFEMAAEIAAARGWHLMPSFHPLLVRGVASYALELLRAAPDLHTLYVPIGLGSGICGAIAAREALRGAPAAATQGPSAGHDGGLTIVGVVCAGAPAYAHSFELGRPVSHAVSTRIADGMACRTPVPEAFAAIRAGADRVVVVSDDEIEEAMRVVFADTHNVVEGAGAAGLAALLQEREQLRGRPAGIVLSGGNVDAEPFVRILARGLQD
jgi:threonine dehydratase